MRALIVDDGYSHTGFAGARALARAGWTIGSGSPSRSLVARSSVCARWHRVDRPEHGLERFVAQVAEAVRTAGYDLVVPSGDAEVLALSAHRSALGARIPYPDHETVTRAFDKLELARAAVAAGVPAPRTELASSATLATFPTPVVVKTRWHWTPTSGSAVSRHEARVCTSRESAERAIEQLRAAGGEPVLQEHVAGSVASVALVLSPEHDVIAAGATVGERILRGSYVTARTVELDERTLAGLTALLRGLGWVGLAHFDLILSADGTLSVIDFNGRWFSSIGLLDAAGVELSALALGAASRAPGAPILRARPGVRMHWLEADLVLAARSRSPRAVVDAFAQASGAVHPYWGPGSRYAAIRYDLRRLRSELAPRREPAAEPGAGA